MTRKRNPIGLLHKVNENPSSVRALSIGSGPIYPLGPAVAQRPRSAPGDGGSGF